MSSGHGHGHKAHKESPSLIPLISAKEKEFSTLLENAERKAKDVVVQAEEDARRTIENAKKKSHEEIEAILSRGEKEITEETARILKTGEEEAKKLRSSLSEKIPAAASVVAEFILPNGKNA